MLGLGSSSEKRIILINFEGLTVYGLDNDRLMRLGVFIDDDVGHDKFRTYIIDESLTQISLVVDSPAEDFIVEKVVHVSPYDRKSFLTRKLEQHFRNVEFRSAKVLGREKTGRRDDRVLFSAITQTRNVDNWVRLLLQEQVSIKSITSPAFAICKVARELGLETSEEFLLVNWQRNGIRQSLISDNKLMFSRLTPLPLDPEADLAKAILDATLQTVEYLDRIGLLQTENAPDLHVVSPILEEDAFVDQPGSADFGVVFHHNSIDLMPIEKYGGPQNEITAIVLCLDWSVRNGDFGNIYASQGAMRFTKLRMQRNFIAFGCLLAFFIGGVISAPVLTDTLQSQSIYRTITADMQPIQQQYDELTAQFPATPIPSEAMALVVNNYDLISNQNHYPVELLNEISQVVAQHPTINLSSIVWKLVADEQFLEINDAILANSVTIELELYGAQLGSSGYENSDSRLRAFMDSLSTIEGATVTAIRLPIETGPNASVTAVVGGEQFDSEFSLSVRIES
ncbi:MAG: hypothetical protein COB20_00155 [SAR86 cluster bacterium]|uniref:GspL cytoplasmic actin-ATPase-like domain-containing protein n=1 Tax=SAR86 cluster bacterium TaxID=2030880 RepID=A0A2A4XIP2_9GAMM|nr:MAG: hypothetical protein COB20_00155 [SAR86 cluster bacterium]